MTYSNSCAFFYKEEWSNDATDVVVPPDWHVGRHRRNSVQQKGAQLSKQYEGANIIAQ